MVEYLAAAAWCFFHTILAGDARKVAARIRAKATRAGLKPSARHNVDKAATYLVNKAAYLDYPRRSRADGPSPPACAVCRHPVTDRLDRTGARWDVEGAEAVLKLRAIISNDDCDAYYHLDQEHQRVH